MSDSHSVYRNKRGEDLLRFATAIQKSQISCDVSGLTEAGSRCCTAIPAGDGTWGYSFEGLILSAPDPTKHIRPVGATLKAVEINVDLQGRCIDEGEENGDPLLHLGVEILLNGELIGDDEIVGLRSAWYMDRHNATAERLDSGMSLKCPVHPYYHVQFGGKHAKAIDAGGMIVASPPRLAHPPMDAILAVDFVVANYFSSQWLTLREDAEYARLVGEAQQRFWRPYADALLRNWESSTQGELWEACDLWPQLLS